MYSKGEINRPIYGGFPLIFYMLPSLIVGVLIAFYANTSISVWILVFASILPIIISLNWVSKRTKRSILPISLSCGLMILIGLFLGQLEKPSGRTSYFTNYLSDGADVFQLRLLEQPIKKSRSYKCRAEVQKVNSSKSSGEVILYFENIDALKDLKYGDIILTNAEENQIKNRGNPMEFDYAGYMRTKGLHHQFYIREQQWKMVGNDGNWFDEWIFSLRSSLSARLDNSSLNGRSRAIAKALLLGQKDELDPETRAAFASAGVMHVLAVSGLHLGIIMLILTFLLKPLKRLSKGHFLYLFGVLGIIWFFAFFTGLSPSVFRAAVMFSFIVLGMELQRETSIYQSLMVSAFVLIVCDPFIIFQIGFQLSYLAVISIVYLQPRIYEWVYIPNKFLDNGWQLIAVSLAAQIGTFPLSIYYFHQFPNYFLFSNLVVIPLTFILLLVAIIYVLTIWIPLISELVLFLFDFLLSIMNSFVSFVDGLAYSTTGGLYLTFWELLLAYVAMFLLIRAAAIRNFKFVLLGIFTVCVLFTVMILDRKAANENKQLVFYNVANHVAVDIWFGNQNVFFSSGGLKEDKVSFDFGLSNYWIYKHGSDLPIMESSPRESPYFKFDREIGAFVDSTLIAEQRAPQMANLIYLYDVNYIDGELLSEWQKSIDHLIIGPGVGFRLRTYCSEIFGNKVKNLKRDGAFILNF